MDEVRANAAVESYSKLKVLEDPAIIQEFSVVTALESSSLLKVINDAIDTLTLTAP
jgi:hypothetical protein